MKDFLRGQFVMNISSNTNGDWFWIRIYRWLFKKCMDCGATLGNTYNRGDVCDKCFDDFNGLTIDDMMSE